MAAPTRSPIGLTANAALAGIALVLAAATAGSAEAPVAWHEQPSTSGVVARPAVADRGTHSLPAAGGRVAAGSAPYRTAGALRILGQLGGDVRAVAWMGDRAVIGVGPRVAVVDIADPTAPRLLGQTGMLRGTVIDLEVQGALAYAIAGGLSIVDLGDPAMPREIGYAAVGARDSLYGWTGPSRLSVGDEVVAVIGHSVHQLGRPVFFDVSDPTAPAMAAELELDFGADVVMDGRTAYIGDCVGSACQGPGQGLAVYDLDDPWAPRLVGHAGAPEVVWRLALAGPRLVTIGSECQAGMFDAGDPAAMTRVGCQRPWADSGQSDLSDISFDGATLTGVDPYGGVHAVDMLSTPARSIGFAPIASAGFGIAAADGLVLLAAGPEGLQIVDAHDLADPHLLGAIDLGGDNAELDRAFAATPRLAFVPAGNPPDWRIALVDIHDPTAPRVVGAIPIYARRVAPFGEGHLVTDDQSAGIAGAGLRVYDVSVPARAALVATLPLSATVQAMTTDGRALYFVDRYGLSVVDLSDPTRPVRLASLPIDGGASDVAVAGGYAFVAAARLSIVDVRDPADPRTVASIGDPETRMNLVAADSGRAYVIDGFRRLWGVDVRDPVRPSELWRIAYPYPSGYPVNFMAARDGRLHLAAERGGLWVFDVGGAAPRLASSVAPLLGNHWWIGQPQAVALAGPVTCVLDAYRVDGEDPRPGPPAVPGQPYDLRLRLFDLADGADVHAVGQLGGGLGFLDVVADGGHAFLADGARGIHAVDVSDAAAPVEVASVPVADGAYRLVKNDRFLYVLARRLIGERPLRYAVYDTSLAVLDIADPARPLTLDLVQRPGLDDLAIVDGRLVVAGDDGMSVFDIAADPAHPREIGHLGSSLADVGYTLVAGSGRHAFVVRPASTIRSGGTTLRRIPPILRSIDLGDPARPEIVAEMPIADVGTRASVRAIAVTGGRAYLALGLDWQLNGALVVVDVGDPARPTIVGYWDTAEPGLHVVPAEPSGVDATAHHAFWSSYAGIRALDLTVPGYPLEVARLDTPEEGLYPRLGEAILPDGKLLLARGDGGLLVVDFEAPELDTPTAGPSPTRTASATPLPTFTRLPTNTPTPFVRPTRGPTRTRTPWPTDAAFTATSAARTATIEALTRTPVPTDLPWTATLAARTATASARTATAGARTATANARTGTPWSTEGAATATAASWTATSRSTEAALTATVIARTVTAIARTVTPVGTPSPGPSAPTPTGSASASPPTAGRVWLPVVLDSA